MRRRAIPLLVIALFLMAQVVVLAGKPDGVGPNKNFCAGNSHICFVDGVKTVDPERFPGNAAPDVEKEPPQKGERGIIGRAGRSNNAFMELWAKDPSTWEILLGEGWGKLRYNVAGTEFEYHFNGHLLMPYGEYALIIYVDPWPGEGSVLLATGTADEWGNLLLKGSEYLGEDLEDAKIWLVYADDFDADDSKMVGWNPTGYLFEYDLISYSFTGGD